MRLTLTYEGKLLARGNARHKEHIRQVLHPQLAELWTHDPLTIHPELLQPDERDGGITVLKQVGDRVYAPLVCSSLKLSADIDILLLRPERPGGIVTSGGDIDNRLKTLFDAFGVPTQPQDIADNASRSTAESPTHTLLEDDRLIARISVDTDRLLAAPEPEFVQLIIRVSLRASKRIMGNMNLLG